MQHSAVYFEARPAPDRSDSAENTLVGVIIKWVVGCQTARPPSRVKVKPSQLDDLQSDLSLADLPAADTEASWGHEKLNIATAERKVLWEQFYQHCLLLLNCFYWILSLHVRLRRLLKEQEWLSKITVWLRIH